MPTRTVFSPSATSLNNGLAVGKPSPTKTVCVLPFIFTIAAFGGVLAVKVIVPEAAGCDADALVPCCFLRAQMKASVWLLTTTEQFDGTADLGFGFEAVDDEAGVDDDGVDEDDVDVGATPISAWKGSLKGSFAKARSCAAGATGRLPPLVEAATAGAALVVAPVDGTAEGAVAAAGGGDAFGGLICFISFGTWITSTIRKIAESPPAIFLLRLSLSCAAVIR